MAYVVTEQCIGQCFRNCVDACPEDCFYVVPRASYLHGFGFMLMGTDELEVPSVGMLVIHPDQCIDCGACETECPVEAIYEETTLPEGSVEFTKINAAIARGLNSEEQHKRRCQKR